MIRDRRTIVREGAALALGAVLTLGGGVSAVAQEPVRHFQAALGARPHHVAPTADGAVWFTAQSHGALGRLDPATGEIETVALGERSKPRGVFVGPDGALWVTDSGQNAILRVDPATRELTSFPLTGRRGPVNLYGAAFDGDGRLWFTGQAGVYGRLDPATGEMRIWTAPRGPGPTSITTTPGGDIYFTSYNGNYLARIDPDTGEAVVIAPPSTADERPRVEEGARTGRIESVPQPPPPEEDVTSAEDWPVGPLGLAADSQGRIWVAEKDAGQLAVYDPATDAWQEWPVPVAGAEPYALWIDEEDRVWLSDVVAGGILRFDPDTERFQHGLALGSTARIYHLAGRPGEIWAADTRSDQLILLPTE